MKFHASPEPPTLHERQVFPAPPGLEKIDAILPQTQCGQCGFPGCKPYAQAIAKGEAVTQDTSTLENPAILDQLGEAW